MGWATRQLRILCPYWGCAFRCALYDHLFEHLKYDHDVKKEGEPWRTT